MRFAAVRWVRRAAPIFGLALLSITGCIQAQAEPEEIPELAGGNEEGLTGSLPVGTSLQTMADLNLRAEPSTAAKILDVMPSGSKVSLQTTAPTNGFYQVTFEGTVGWASGKYLEPAGGGTNGPAAATLTATADVNLRSGPSTATAILAVVPAGSEVKVEKPDPVDGFYNVTYQGLTGWSSGKYLAMSTPAAATPFANGLVWKFRAKKLAVDVAVFVPAAAAQASEVDVLLYVHGLNVCSPVAKQPPVSFVTDPPFELAEIIDASARPVVLAVPFMDWEHLAGNGMAFAGSNHKLAIPQNLNGVIDEVLSQVGQRATTKPALGSLLVAGHSRAYGLLNPLAAAHADPQMSQGALAKLTRVWGLDSSYSCSGIQSWTSLIASKPSLEVTMIYRAGTGTADCGKQFASLVPKSDGRLSVKVAPESHCAVPSTELPLLLGDLP